jgi:error-prone DNA polymerase
MELRGFISTAKKNEIKAHIGSEITTTDGSDYPLLVKNRTGYQNLCRLITLMKYARQERERSRNS